MNILDRVLRAKKTKLSELQEKRKTFECSAIEEGGLDNHIQEIEDQIYALAKSRMEPARAGDIVINNKLYEKFIKTLKGFEVQVSVVEDRLILKYGKEFGNWTGTLELFDISSYFEGHGEVSKEADLLWML